VLPFTEMVVAADPSDMGKVPDLAFALGAKP
jgi:hypothetical protein